MTLRLHLTSSSKDSPLDIVQAFDSAQVTFGRALENDLTIPDSNKEVSSRHGRFDRRDGKYYVVDLQSLNGTELNNVRLEAHRAREVKNGDVLLLCSGAFAIKVEVEVGQATDLGATIAHASPANVARNLGDRLGPLYAELLHERPEARMDRIRREIRGELERLSPEGARAVLTELQSRFAAGASGSTARAQPDQHEELFQAGHRILGDIAKHFVAGERYKSTESAARFGRLLTQTLDTCFEWLAKSMDVQREFESQFGVDMNELQAGNPIRSGRKGEEIGEFLLDWRRNRNMASVRRHLEEAFKGLNRHNLGLVQGVSQSIRRVLKKLDPALIENAVKQAGGLRAKIGVGSAAWDKYKSVYRDVLSESGRLHDEIIAPTMRRAFMEAYEEQKKREGGSETPTSG